MHTINKHKTICVPAKTSNVLFPAGKERPIAARKWIRNLRIQNLLKKIRGALTK